jgi:hypothetical protein
MASVLLTRLSAAQRLRYQGLDALIEAIKPCVKVAENEMTTADRDFFILKKEKDHLVAEIRVLKDAMTKTKTTTN